MALIDGLGGAFLFSDDPRALAAWYTKHLDLEFEGDDAFGAYYVTFWARSDDQARRRVDTTFSIIRARRSFAQPVPDVEPDSVYGDQPFMVNLRTTNLEALLAHLATLDVYPIEAQDEPYGRFAWIRDAEGHRIELYEPIPPPDQPDAQRP
jgi:catechol 2,3-dioxygenase-like lactoylglutathione lyase family enzyme